MINANRKGGAFERWCSRKLSLWWTDGDRDDCVWRTSGSGATHTNRSKKGMTTAGQAGDLCAQDESMLVFFDNFLVECKKGYGNKKRPAEMIGVLYCIDRAPRATETPLFIKWFMKALDESYTAGRSDALLIFQRTGRIPCIVMQLRTMNMLSEYAGRYKRDRVVFTYYQPKSSVVMNRRTPTLQLVIIPLELFFDWCHADHMKQYLYNRKCR